MHVKVRIIQTIDELNHAVKYLDSSIPSWFERTGRPRDYWHGRFASEYPLYGLLEDSAGIIGAILGKRDKSAGVLGDAWISPEFDTASARALLIQTLSKSALTIGITRFAAPEHFRAAALYEEIGFDSTLFVQLYGEERFFWRRKLITDCLADHRVVQLRDFAGIVAQAALRIDEVNQSLLSKVEEEIPACDGGSLFMMNCWIGEQDATDAEGRVLCRRPRHVVTHYPRFRQSALDEVFAVDPDIQIEPASELSRSVVVAGRAGYNIASAFLAKKPVFVQHLAPANWSVPLTGSISDMRLIADTIAKHESLRCDQTFVVQCRKSERTSFGSREDAPYTAKDVEVHVGMHLSQSTGSHRVFSSQ